MRSRDTEARDIDNTSKLQGQHMVAGSRGSQGLKQEPSHFGTHHSLCVQTLLSSGKHVPSFWAQSLCSANQSLSLGFLKLEPREQRLFLPVLTPGFVSPRETNGPCGGPWWRKPTWENSGDNERNRSLILERVSAWHSTLPVCLAWHVITGVDRAHWILD